MILRISPMLRESLRQLSLAEGASFNPVANEAQLQACVGLQVESVLNRSGELAPSPKRYATNLRRAMDRANEVIVTIEREGAVVGFLWVCFRVLADGEDTLAVCHVNSLVLTQAARGRGLGSAVMQELHTCSRAAGIGAVSLNYMHDNERITPFYLRLGYAPTGVDLHAKLESPRARPSPAGVRPFDASVEAHLELLGAAQRSASVRAAFEPQAPDHPGCPLWVVEQGGKARAIVELCVRNNMAGLPIVVLEQLFVEPSSLGDEVVDAIAATVESAAAEAGAHDVYLTLWTPGGEVQRALSDHGYAVGRFKVMRRLP